jgi:aspartate-semialdehyde dehydrogenase
MPTINVAVLGATGAVGQRFVQLLQGHPWFRVVALTGSERSAGKSYGSQCRWVLDGDIPEELRAIEVLPDDAELDAPLVFSALPSGPAGPIEERLARAGHIVCTNARAHRDDVDVPLLIPEVNPEHLELIAAQRRRRGWSGAIVCNPNCTATGPTMAAKPLHEAFGITKMLVMSMQALSGAGYPGVPSLDAIDTVMPYIGGEEERVELEPRKMLGTLEGEGVSHAPIAISAHCNRVPAIDGHLTPMSLSFAKRASLDEVQAALREWRPLPQQLGLPTAPARPLIVHEAPDRPQLRRDRMAGGGMAVGVGPCAILEYKLVVLAHNTIRGAAGGSILNAELMVAQGLL